MASAAALSNLKDVSLELGGKSPAIIFDDACLDTAAGCCAFSSQWNSGQICMMNSRLYVHAKVYDAFIEKFKVAFGNFKHGDPTDATTTLGPQADEIQGKIVLGYLDIGKKDGNVVMGGNRVKDMKVRSFLITFFTGIFSLIRHSMLLGIFHRTYCIL